MKKLCLVCACMIVAMGSAGALEACATLEIPAQEIRVELRLGNQQTIVDDPKYAALFPGGVSSWVIADHDYQAFRMLKKVQVGDKASITRADGKTIRLKCVDKYKGKNTGHAIRSMDGRNVMSDHDVMMYTCRFGWRRVWVLQWEMME